MPFDGEAIGESDAAACRVARVGPVSGFEQHGVEHAEFDYFAGDAIDFDPVSEADSVLAHQHEPADEPDDEILERDGEARTGKTKESSEIRRRAKDNEQDQ